MAELRPVELPTEFQLTEEELKGLLLSVFSDSLDGLEPKVISRDRADYTSTFPNEVVRCRIRDQQFDLFCKYEGGFFEDSFGHRGGVAREARVYEEILVPLRVTVPRFYGAVVDKHSGWTSLVLEYLRGARRTGDHADPAATIARVAAWAGNFHRAATSLSVSRDLVPTYDVEYFSRWADRAVAYSSPGASRQVLEKIAAGFASAAAELVASPRTVIHGEYYPKNTVVFEGEIYPTDWESAAFAVGEIDLAALTEYWPDGVVEQCKAAYAAARWDGAPPEGLDRRLDLSYAYLHFRWLGDEEADVRERNAQRLDDLVPLAEKLGLI